MANLFSRVTTSDWLIIFLLFLQLWDFATSYYIIRKGGRELNPFIAQQINVFGLLTTLIVVKFLFVPTLIFIGYFYGVWNNNYGITILAGLDVWYTVAGFNNFHAIINMRRQP